MACRKLSDNGIGRIRPFSHHLALCILFHCYFISRIFCIAKPDQLCRHVAPQRVQARVITPAILYFISCVFISSRVLQLWPAINARSSASPIPYRVHKFSIFGEVFRGGGWLLIIMEEFLIPFALMLPLHPPIILVLPLSLLLLYTCSVVCAFWPFCALLPYVCTALHRRFHASQSILARDIPPIQLRHIRAISFLLLRTQ